MPRVGSRKAQRARTIARPALASAARVAIVATLLAATLGPLAGCGQRGPLYYPDANNPDRRR